MNYIIYLVAGNAALFGVAIFSGQAPYTLPPQVILGIKIVGTLTALWIIFYGIVQGFVKEKICLLGKFQGALGEWEGFGAWFIGFVWIMTGLYFVYIFNLFHPVTQVLAYIFDLPEILQQRVKRAMPDR